MVKVGKASEAVCDLEKVHSLTLLPYLQELEQVVKVGKASEAVRELE